MRTPTLPRAPALSSPSIPLPARRSRPTRGPRDWTDDTNARRRPGYSADAGSREVIPSWAQRDVPRFRSGAPQHAIPRKITSPSLSHLFNAELCPPNPALWNRRPCRVPRCVSPYLRYAAVFPSVDALVNGVLEIRRLESASDAGLPCPLLDSTYTTYVQMRSCSRWLALARTRIRVQQACRVVKLLDTGRPGHAKSLSSVPGCHLPASAPT